MEHGDRSLKSFSQSEHEERLAKIKPVLEGTVGIPEEGQTMIPVIAPFLGSINPIDYTIQASTGNEVNEKLQSFANRLKDAGITQLVQMGDVRLIADVLKDRDIGNPRVGVTVPAFLGIRNPQAPQSSEK